MRERGGVEWKIRVRVRDRFGDIKGDMEYVTRMLWFVALNNLECVHFVHFLVYAIQPTQKLH